MASRNFSAGPRRVPPTRWSQLGGLCSSSQIGRSTTLLQYKLHHPSCLASVLSLVAEPPSGFYWGLDTTNPDAKLEDAPVTMMDRLNFGNFDSFSSSISEQ